VGVHRLFGDEISLVGLSFLLGTYLASYAQNVFCFAPIFNKSGIG
jgi:hypothetical protein